MFVNLKNISNSGKASFLQRGQTVVSRKMTAYPNLPFKAELFNSIMADIANAHVPLACIYKHSLKTDVAKY